MSGQDFGIKPAILKGMRVIIRYSNDTFMGPGIVLSVPKEFPEGERVDVHWEASITTNEQTLYLYELELPI